jgi:hypothetical protein
MNFYGWFAHYRKHCNYNFWHALNRAWKVSRNK